MENWAYPVPVKSKISQTFGKRPEFYKPLGYKAHPGVDFAVVIGTIVKSVWWGEVFKVGYDEKGYGLYIIVKYGNYLVIYAHLSAITVIRGCYVTKGQAIAKTGNTGNSSGPHIHFGIRDMCLSDNGYQGYIDPMPFLKKNNLDCTDILKKIQAEINQMKKDRFNPSSCFIHAKYIEKIIRENTK